VDTVHKTNISLEKTEIPVMKISDNYGQVVLQSGVHIFAKSILCKFALLIEIRITEILF
jgi:hypothetical protein